MATELVLDASVSLAWFLKETPERAAYAATVSAAVVDLASRYHLQGYDALYFHLARSMGLPLATLDHGHRQAARTHNVTLFAVT